MSSRSTRVALSASFLIAAAILELSFKMFLPFFGTLGAYLPLPTRWALNTAGAQVHWVLAIVACAIIFRYALTRSILCMSTFAISMVTISVWYFVMIMPLYDLGHEVVRAGEYDVTPPTEVLVKPAAFPHPYLTATARTTRGHYVMAVVTCTNVQPFVGSEDGWGTGANSIERLSAFVDSVPISVPASAFIGLSDPHAMKIDWGEDTFSIRITGGDASASYYATYEFEYTIDAALIMWRSIQHGEYPDERYERTVYSYVSDVDH